MSTPDRFHALMRDVARLTAGHSLDAGLQAKLNLEAGPRSALFQDIFAACRQGVADGWMCSREGGGIRYGRVIKPAPDLWLEAVKRLGFPAGERLAIEDSLNGVKSAKAAGLNVWAVPNRTTACLDFSLADQVVASLELL